MEIISTGNLPIKGYCMFRSLPFTFNDDPLAIAHGILSRHYLDIPLLRCFKLLHNYIRNLTSTTVYEE